MCIHSLLSFTILWVAPWGQSACHPWHASGVSETASNPTQESQALSPHPYPVHVARLSTHLCTCHQEKQVWLGPGKAPFDWVVGLSGSPAEATTNMQRDSRQVATDTERRQQGWPRDWEASQRRCLEPRQWGRAPGWLFVLTTRSLSKLKSQGPWSWRLLGICIFSWLHSGGGAAGPSRAPGGSSGRRLPSGPRWDGTGRTISGRSAGEGPRGPGANGDLLRGGPRGRAGPVRVADGAVTEQWGPGTLSRAER